MNTTAFKRPLILAATLTCGAALAQAPSAAPAFQATRGCETVKGYDAAWAGYGDEYGLKLKPKADYEYIFGFYQLAHQDGRLYAAFGGAYGGDGPVKGATPGALVVLDADTLRFEKAIALPFHAHALALNPAKGQAIVTHTKANAFSLVDLASGQVRCRKPDTRFQGQDYRGRYVVADERGDFYINYHAGWDGGAGSVVMKYDARGEHARGFAVQVTEENMAIPLYYRDGQLLTGARGVKAVSANTGAVSRLTTENAERNLFNYVQGPGGTILGTDQNHEGRPGVYQFDPGRNSHSALFTGRTALELAYDEANGQLFVTNLDSQTVSVIALPGDARSVAGRPFVNILLDGDASNLHLRRTTHATELFVSPKSWDDETHLENHGLIQKIRIANTVKGIEGIDAPGACTVTTFDYATRQVSQPGPCRLLDARATYRHELKKLQERIGQLEKQREEAQPKLARARADLARARQTRAGGKALDRAQEQVKNLEAHLGWLDKTQPQTRVAVEVFGRLAEGR